MKTRMIKVQINMINGLQIALERWNISISTVLLLEEKSLFLENLNDKEVYFYGAATKVS